MSDEKDVYANFNDKVFTLMNERAKKLKPVEISLEECNICMENTKNLLRCSSCLHCYVCRDCICKYGKTKCPVCRATYGFQAVETTSDDLLTCLMRLWQGSGLPRTVRFSAFPASSWVELVWKSGKFTFASCLFELVGDDFNCEIKWRVIPGSSVAFYENGELLPYWQGNVSTETIVNLFEFHVTESMIEEYKITVN